MRIRGEAVAAVFPTSVPSPCPLPDKCYSVEGKEPVLKEMGAQEARVPKEFVERKAKSWKGEDSSQGIKVELKLTVETSRSPAWVVRSGGSRWTLGKVGVVRGGGKDLKEEKNGKWFIRKRGIVPEKLRGEKRGKASKGRLVRRVYWSSLNKRETTPEGKKRARGEGGREKFKECSNKKIE